MPFAPGRLIVRRHYQRGHLLSRVWAGHVAADDERGLAVWIADGSAFADVGAADGRPFREVPFGDWGRTGKRLSHLRWATSVLMLHPPQADALSSAEAAQSAFSQADALSSAEAAQSAFSGDHSVWLFFAPDGTFRSWYVNLERPAARWALGIDTVDYDLDIVAAPDRTWQWKDEDEFADHLAHPDVYWCDDEHAVRAEGHRVVKLIEAGQYPFDETWTGFVPDPSWPVPSGLPDGWDAPRAW